MEKSIRNKKAYGMHHHKLLLVTAKVFIWGAFFLIVQNNVLAQNSIHDLNHGHSHDHRHNHVHGIEHGHGHEHSHLQVDYSFRSDAGNYTAPEPDEHGYYWWKGNLHTHTLWSDGDQFPEVVTQWYYKHGYHFLAISDHNILMRGERWIRPGSSRHAARGGGTDVYDLYLERFGSDWVEKRYTDSELEVRLKPLQETRALFEKAGRFIMIESEEITGRQVHVNATNILELIEPREGETIEESIRLNIDAVIEQREKTGQRMIPHLNHPNWRNNITAEDMAPVENMQLFEIYNGHRGVINFGDGEGTKDLDRVWDIVLTKRLGELGLGMLYGVATDDAHNYEESSSETSMPGRGWVMVRSKFLTPESIVRALENGDFYSSTGVEVRKLKIDGNRYEIELKPEDGVDYVIQFIGTRTGYDSSSEPFVDGDGNVRNDRTRRYSNDIGEVLMEVNGNRAVYEFEGDEIYVRAKVISSKPKENYFAEGEREKAWFQPVQPMRNLD